jgi:hypothetical protein
VDELTFAARRAVASLPRPAEGPDLEMRFRNLVQSPLRAGLLRFLSARPDELFDVEGLMSTFGRLRLDVENCVNELCRFRGGPQGGRDPAEIRRRAPVR